MTCVANYCAVLHIEECFFGDYIVASGHGYKEIAVLRRLNHRHYGEAVHNRLHRLDFVNFRDNHLCAESFGTHCNALAAPAVACHDRGFTGNYQICCPVYAVPYGLTRAVSVVKQIFALSVVHGNHRETKLTVIFHGFEAYNSRSCLLTAADNAACEVRGFVVNGVYEIAAVIDYHVGAAFEDFFDVRVVFFRRCAVLCKYIETALYECRGNVVLS